MNESPIVRARPSLFAGDRSQAPAHQLDSFVRPGFSGLLVFAYFGRQSSAVFVFASKFTVLNCSRRGFEPSRI